jgi:hypothetical protein
MTKKQPVRVTIGTTVNIGNHEFIKVEVEGASSQQCKSIIVDTLNGLGKQSEVTRDMIQAYQRRVLE